MQKFTAFLFCLAFTSGVAQEKLFTSLLPTQTGIQFANQLAENERFNIIKYLYFYNGGGVAAGDLNNDGLPDLYFTTNQLPDRIYLNKGSFQFEDITKKAGLPTDLPQGKNRPGKWKTGVTFADVNADGWLDIYVCEVGFYKSVNGRNRLYINNGVKNGQLTFTERAAEYGLDFKGFAQQAIFFDYDLDGDLDLFLLTHSVHSAETYVKAEKRTERDSMAGDYLFKNEGGKFKDVSEQAGIFGAKMGYGLAAIAADFNNDGCPDLYVANDFHENDYLYLNYCNGTFTECIASSMGHTSTFSMGVDAADLNNDGWIDLMTLDMKPEFEHIRKASAGDDHYNLQQMKLGFGYHHQFPGNMLQLNLGNWNWLKTKTDNLKMPSGFSIEDAPKFAEIGQVAGVAATDWSWSTLLADFDNDGWKDIFVTNGIWHRPNDLDYLKFTADEEVQRFASDLDLAEQMPSGAAPNYAFLNLGGAFPQFQNVSKDWGLDLAGCSNGAAYADFDNDGDLDLAVNNLNAPASIFRNNSERLGENNFLKIKLEGGAGNSFGVGARVEIVAGGTRQVQELSPVRGWQSSVDYILHFGLLLEDKVEKLEVFWSGGKRQELTNVPANQLLVLKQADAQLLPAAQSITQPFFSTLTDFPTSLPRHQENRFLDFNIESLMPHLLSTQGPKLAVGDVNGDGQADFYLCGAKGQAGQLAVAVGSGGVAGSPLGVGGGQFEISPQPAFEADFLSEDADATFFDADHDGDLDLYVVSGGGEYREGSPQLKDRLYLNDGKGNFSKKEMMLDEVANGSCVVPADFNGDGFTDLFVGSRSVPGSYGLTPKSFIFLNDGKANFRDATAEISPGIAETGMATAAVWLENERLLFVVGEWMPVSIFDFSVPGKASSRQVPKSSGWWNALAAADLDGDGDLDLLAGNHGLNSPLTASPAEPVELYVKDFDENGATDPILTHFRQGKRYPFASKDELTAQLPELKKRFVKYAAFASSTFEQVFDEKILAGAIHKKAETFQSAWFENKGSGNFEPDLLPVQSQLAPIHAFLPGDFDEDGKMDVLAVGNFFGNQPSIGRQDALPGLFLKGNGQRNFNFVEPSRSGFWFSGEGRDVKLLKTGDGGKPLILVARNNEPLLFFQKK